MKDVPLMSDFLSKELPRGSVVAVDPFVHAASAYKKLSSKLLAKEITIRPLEASAPSNHPIDAIWGDSRPPAPSGQIRVHPEEVAGVSVADKLSSVRSELKDANAAALVVAALDEIAWLFNIRGQVIISQLPSHLFVNLPAPLSPCHLH